MVVTNMLRTFVEWMVKNPEVGVLVNGLLGWFLVQAATMIYTYLGLRYTREEMEAMKRDRPLKAAFILTLKA